MCLLSSPLLEASRTCAMKQSQSQNLSAAKKKKTELIIREYFMVVLVTSTIEDNGFYSSQFEDWKNAMLKAIESQCLPKTDECARLPAWKAAFLVVVMNRLKSGKFKKKERKKDSGSPFQCFSPQTVDIGLGAWECQCRIHTKSPSPVKHWRKAAKT